MVYTDYIIGDGCASQYLSGYQWLDEGWGPICGKVCWLGLGRDSHYAGEFGTPKELSLAMPH